MHGGGRAQAAEAEDRLRVTFSHIHFTEIWSLYVEGKRLPHVLFFFLSFIQTSKQLTCKLAD